jgi:hypothetical protein
MCPMPPGEQINFLNLGRIRVSRFEYEEFAGVARREHFFAFNVEVEGVALLRLFTVAGCAPA